MLWALHDTVRPEARQVVAGLRALGKEVRILSGDATAVVQAVAHAVGIDAHHSAGGCTPEEKAAIVSSNTSSSIMVGDGVNDLAALRAATVGIGIRGGLEITCAASDIVLTEGSLDSLFQLFTASDRTLASIKSSLWWAVGYNIVAGYSAISGQLSPLWAALIMPISSISFLLHALKTQPFRREV
jgi:Cu2+-exporting ATPase